MKTFSFKDVYYVCKVNIRDLETKEIVAQPSIKNDMWVPYSNPGDEEYSIKSDFDFDDFVKSVFTKTFDEYLYPRIIAEHAELFKKNFKILDKYFRNDFISEGIVRTDHQFRLAYLRDPNERELKENPGSYAVFWSCYCYTNWNFEIALRQRVLDKNTQPLDGMECGLLDYKFYLYKYLTDEKSY